jgi:small subunit ribosomal protein S20
MPNTKSAERRMRSSARKQARNKASKSRLHTLETKYVGLLKAGKKDEASRAYQGLSSAFDKAAKTGVVHKSTANRKKSRLAIQLSKLK